MAIRERPLFEQALREAGNRDFTLTVLPGVDHGLNFNGASVENTGYTPRYFAELLDWVRRKVVTVTD